MKVYTFNANHDTPVELLYSLRSLHRNSFFQRFIDQNPFQEVNKITECDTAIFPQKAFHPETLKYNDRCFLALQEAKAHNKPLIIDGTCDCDAPLDLPSANILRFGLYHTLQKPHETERPYWFENDTYQSLSSLPIIPVDKPIVGFCGTTASIGKWFKVGKALPLVVSKKLLSQGKFAQSTDIRIKKGMSHSLRAKCLEVLTKDTRITELFDITNQLQDYYNPANLNRKLLEQKFVDNMGGCLYNLCIRANGNYTSRFYMTLIAGRIPVVVDTDSVFPWQGKTHVVRVPAKQLENIGDVILEHFDRYNASEIMAMQEENRQAYQNYMAPHKFIPNFVESVVNGQKERVLFGR